MKRKNKNRSTAGFTFAELMITMLILMLVTLLLASGLPVAVNAYSKVIDHANAQLLLSTTVTRLQEELSTAVEVWTDGTADGNVRIFSHAVNGFKITQTSDATTHALQLAYTKRNNDPIQTIPLITKETSQDTGKNAFFVEYGSIRFNNGVFTISDLEVKSTDPKRPEVQIDPVTLVIRPVKDPILNPEI